MAQFEDRYWTSEDGLRLHYRDYAGPHDRPPILCLPGLTRNARDFEPVADRYSGEWRVIAVDFRGRGLSEYDPHPENYTPSTYARDLLKLLDQLGIADAVFLGTSLGGIVTMLIGLTDPERIAGALINDVGPVVEPDAVDRLRRYVGQEGRFSDWPEAARAVAERNGIAFPHFGMEQWEKFARRTCVESADGTVSFQYDPAIAQPFAENAGTPPTDPWPLIEGLKQVPVTILRGEISDLLTPATAEKMIQVLPLAKLTIVPAVGHAPTLEEPESLAAMDDLLSRVLTQ